jgi:large subunit ribosomal protein L14
MICHLTKLNVADNSGPLLIECIKILSKKKAATIGEEIIATVQKRHINPNFIRHIKRPLKKGAIIRAIIVRTKKAIIRANGSKLEFDENAAVLYSPKTEKLLGSRIIGTIPRELRKWNYLKILSLAERVI